MGKKNYGQMKRFTVTEAQAALLLRMIGHCRKDKTFADTNANLWRALERNVRNAEAVDTTAHVDSKDVTDAMQDPPGMAPPFDNRDANGHERSLFVTCDNCGAHKDSEAYTQRCPGPKPSEPPPRDPRDVRASARAILDVHEGRALVGSEASIAAQRAGKS